MLPDGRWDGWYRQGGARSPQHQDLVFADGIVRGVGKDLLGTFTIEGEYALSSARSGRIGWVKTYRGSHAVLYLGEWDGTEILGQWSIVGSGDGFGFHPARTHP